MNPDLLTRIEQAIGQRFEEVAGGPVGALMPEVQRTLYRQRDLLVDDVKEILSAPASQAALRAVPQTPDELKQYACDGLNKLLGSMVGRTYLGSDGLRVYGALQTALMSGDPRAAAFLQYWSGLVGETTPKE